MGIEECICSLKHELTSDSMQQQIDQFLAKAEYASKWMLCSDYCLDDKSKPNDVITFVMIPFNSMEQVNELDSKIAETHPKDIKHAKAVNGVFMDYIRQQPILSFSFIINDRQKLFGVKDKEQREYIIQLLSEALKQFEVWQKNAAGMPVQGYYRECSKNLKQQLHNIRQKGKLKGYIDILLITLLGAIYTAEIIKRLPKLEIFGWFPDRDATNEACGQMAMPLFHAIQYNHTGGMQYSFCTSKPDSSVEPFYDNENRIADTICGSLADYDMKDNDVSKDKFLQVLQGLIADNSFMNVYRIFVDDKAHISKVTVYRDDQ